MRTGCAEAVRTRENAYLSCLTLPCVPVKTVGRDCFIKIFCLVCAIVLFTIDSDGIRSDKRRTLILSSLMPLGKTEYYYGLSVTVLLMEN